MPTTDARAHVVPTTTDAPARKAFLDLGLSIRDVQAAASLSARAAIVSALAAAGTPVSATNPLLVARADAVAGRALEYSLNGSTFYPLGGTMWLAQDAFTSSAMPSTFAEGVHLMPTASGGGWPGGIADGIVVVYALNGKTVQQVFRASTILPGAFWRSSNAGGAWSNWAGISAPYAEYVDVVTLDSTSTNPTPTVALSFPANRFTTAPRVWCQSSNSAWVGFVNSITSASCNVFARQLTANTSTLVISVHAIQSNSGSADG